MRVKGQGPSPCALMFVGEGPGAMESQTGIPFHPKAPAGAELTRYLDGYHLPKREEVYITNLVKEWEGGVGKKKQDVTPQDILRDQWELQLELGIVQPKLVVTLGRHSTRWFLGKEVDMEAVHGLLFSAAPTLFQCYFILPCYHPAAGLHQPELAARTAYDLDRLSQILSAPVSHWLGLCWQPSPLKTQIITPWEMSQSPTGEYGIDTEGTVEKPIYVSVSPEAGKACVVSPLLIAGDSVKVVGSVFHNYMWDTQVLEGLGVHVGDDDFHDTMLMAYLLGVEPQGLKALALRHLGMELKEYAEVVGQWVQEFTKTGKPKKKKTFVLGTLDGSDGAIQYAGEDADATGQLKPILWKKIQAAGLEQIYEIDRRVLPVYARMEKVGIPVDLDHYTQFSKDLADELEMRTFCLQLDYPGLNPASADQVAKVIYEQLQIPGGKKTPSGKRYSTSDKILQALKTQHSFIEAIIEWREIQKLKTSFLDPLPSYCRLAPDGSGFRLHAKLLPTRVVSGRLAAKDPNVLALPKHSALGKRFRRGVRAGDGRLLGSWDLNQVELRVLALDSASPSMRAAFAAGIDIHSRTAQKIFGVPPSQQDESLHRLPAKTTNFSIAMGTTGIGLAEQQRKNQYPFPELEGVQFASQQKRYEAQAEVCQAWVNAVIEDWQIAGYIAEKHAEARRWGFVCDRWGRRRYLPSVLSPNKQIREGALREAQAFGPQAGARGFYKQILCRVWREVIKPLRESEGVYIEPLLDIHDDLLLEFQEDIRGWLVPLVDSIFNETFGDLEVPITAKSKVGKEWS